METSQNEPKIKDAEFIAEWRSMLNTFAGIIDKKPAPEKVKEELEELMEAAKLTIYLTGAQKDAIVARCRNYINGNYGVDKIKTDYVSSKAGN